MPRSLSTSHSWRHRQPLLHPDGEVVIHVAIHIDVSTPVANVSSAGLRATDIERLYHELNLTVHPNYIFGQMTQEHNAILGHGCEGLRGAASQATERSSQRGGGSLPVRCPPGVVSSSAFHVGGVTPTSTKRLRATASCSSEKRLAHGA